MSKELIVIIAEGEKTEKQIVDNLKRNFFEHTETSKTIEFLSFKTNIYTLWQVMKKDDFDTEIIEILIERDPEIAERLKSINKKAISEIYLFFDYDGHAYKVDEVDAIITEMIDVFDNETENGKMYISYPMVEAVKHLKRRDNFFEECCVPAKKNIRYKGIVGEKSDFHNLSILTTEDWHFIVGKNLKKINKIVYQSLELPNYSNYKKEFNQPAIFQHQLTKFIKMDETVAVLSGFPFFLIDYFGENLYNKVIEG